MHEKRVKVGLVHTAATSLSDFSFQFMQILPNVELINIVDDSLITEIVENLVPSPFLISRLSQYYRICEELNCRCILNQCTSIGNAIDIASKLVSIPVFKVDSAMAKEAITLGDRVGVVATAPSTLQLSKAMFENTAKEMNRDVRIKIYYCKGAHETLFKKGDRIVHDRMVAKTVEEAAKENDVIALAQASMKSTLSLLSKISIPVLNSVESSVKLVKDFLEKNKLLDA